MLTEDQERFIQNILADNELTKLKDAAYAALDILEKHPERFTPNHLFETVDGVQLKRDDVLWGGQIVPTWAEPEPNWEKYDVQPIVARMSGLGAFLYAYFQDGATDEYQAIDTWKFARGSSKSPSPEYTDHEWACYTLRVVIGECDESLNEEYCRLEEEMTNGDAENE